MLYFVNLDLDSASFRQENHVANILLEHNMKIFPPKDFIALTSSSFESNSGKVIAHLIVK